VHSQTVKELELEHTVDPAGRPRAVIHAGTDPARYIRAAPARKRRTVRVLVSLPDDEIAHAVVTELLDGFVWPDHDEEPVGPNGSRP
jgi:hypothetical protein